MSSMVLYDVQSALAYAIRQIKQVNNYQTDLKPENVHTQFSQELLLRTQPEDFPRVMVISSDGDFDENIGGAQSAVYRFLVTAQFQRTGPASAAPNELELAKSNFITDFRTAIHQNTTLAGVTDVVINQFATDNGTLDPQAMVVFELEVIAHGQ